MVFLNGYTLSQKMAMALTKTVWDQQFIVFFWEKKFYLQNYISNYEIKEQTASYFENIHLTLKIEYII